MLRPDEIIVDLFAGGGGASAGIFAALNRHPDLAVDHDETAIGVHAANHPETQHACASVWAVEPRAICAGRPVGLLWASPDCRHFSRAAGGRPRWKSVRSLPGVVLTWASRVRPRVIVVENVREFLGWGPLLQDGTPCPDRIGRSFNTWVGRLRGLGYRVQWRELNAADFGAPTTRTRLFVVARCDGEPIAWPQPTHQKGAGLLGRPWRGAAEIIDWSQPCPSIFTRTRPLAEATLRRIALGVSRFVLGAGEPFMIPVTHRDASNRARGLDAPLSTITASSGGEHALVAAFLAQHNGGAVGGTARRPLSTVTTTATQQQVVTAAPADDDAEGAARVAAFLVRYNGQNIGQPLSEPMGTLTTLPRFALVTVHGVPRPIVDIGMRMLMAKELAATQAFPPGYVLDRTADGRQLTKRETVRLIGNSVCPPVAEAVVRANFHHALTERAAA